MRGIPIVFLGVVGLIFFLSYRTSLSWAPITFAGLEPFEGQFLQELQR
jgi:hypothetical protein